MCDEDSSIPHRRIYLSEEAKEILEKIDRVAVHASDLDGIASAAILLLLKPTLKIDFLTVTEAKKAPAIYDLVVDLPKIGDAINIDHHKTNFENLLQSGRLSGRDLVDPASPSATALLAKYLGIDSDPHIEKIVEIANLADTGKFTEGIYLIDKIIKCYSRNPEALLKVAWAVAKYGDRFLEDPWLRGEISRLQKVFDQCKDLSKFVVEETIKKRNVKALILHVESGVPRICIGDLMHDFIESGGKIVVLINTMREKDPYCPSLTENMGQHTARISVRVRDVEFDARKFLERFGGGGHSVAAGAKLPIDLLPMFLLEAFQELSRVLGEVLYLNINRDMLGSIYQGDFNV